jgi:hypothetical protein
MSKQHRLSDPAIGYAIIPVRGALTVLALTALL